ncbi:alpha-1,2-fucosyltransferase [Parapedobacter sp. DT-150]|uniref:alpha-1,2-fucosyltransferase n=1 Tax=Parapedobacter sp. DT-150 TaxID=3396162 RepID=UPI003F19E065
MKIVKFLGGLGNQLFQYAFYEGLRQTFGKVKADLSGFENYGLHQGFELEKVFGIQLRAASKVEIQLYTPDNRAWAWRKLRRLYRTKDAYYEENPLFGYDQSIYQDKRNRYYWGYWQNIRYVTRVADTLRRDFSFPALTDERDQHLAGLVASNASVAVHVRRGDYLTDPYLGGICTDAYYRQAIDYMKQHITTPLFVFFSNDIQWCRENFRHLDAVFVDWNTGKNSFRDMQLMSLCQHYIIANSSFSWWGAWLNHSPSKIVVSPAKWINMEQLDVSGVILPEFVVF